VDGPSTPPASQEPEEEAIETTPDPASLPAAPPWSSQTKLAVGIGLVIGAFLVLWLSKGVLTIVALSALIAFLLAPAIRWMNTKLKVPRAVALLITYFLVLVLTLAVGVLIAGSVVASIRELNPADAVEGARQWLLSVVDEGGRVVVFGMKLDLNQVLEPIQGWLQGEGNLPVDGDGNVIEITTGHLSFLFGGLLGSVQSVLGFIVAIFTSALVTALVAIYLNADSRKYHEGLSKVVPPTYEGDAVRLGIRIKRVWTWYMYGQLVNSLITGLLVWGALELVGLPGAFLMGFIMLLLNMIPTIGPILAAVPGILAALIQGTTRFDNMNNLVFALIVTGIYIVVVQAQANIIAPRVMGSAVNLRPAVVMIGLMVGLQVAGLLGSLLAVPIIATAREVVRYLYAKLIDRDPWPDEDDLEAPRDAVLS